MLTNAQKQILAIRLERVFKKHRKKIIKARKNLKRIADKLGFPPAKPELFR